MNYTKKEQDLICLCSFTELTYAARNCLLTESGELKDGWTEMIKKGGDGVYNKIRENFFDPSYRSRTLSGLEEAGIECVTLFSKDYPPLLREIPAPPHVLFLRGRRELLKEPMLAVVGSRKTLPYALAECAKFCSALSEEFAIVSGGADGADSAALSEALKKGKAVAVLASGADRFYPSSSARLLERIAEDGLIITEYFTGVLPRPYYFPVRNRIIAGLARGALVVSAGQKSGALITAGYAGDYGREVFAFPYNIGVKSGEGCNALIKQGAYLADSPEDIASALGFELTKREERELSGDEERAYAILTERGEIFLPELAEAMHRQPYELVSVLSSLEIKKLAVRLGGNRYAAVK